MIITTKPIKKYHYRSYIDTNVDVVGITNRLLQAPRGLGCTQPPEAYRTIDLHCPLTPDVAHHQISPYPSEIH